jgi:hypothetical protein
VPSSVAIQTQIRIFKILYLICHQLTKLPHLPVWCSTYSLILLAFVISCENKYKFPIAQ